MEVLHMKKIVIFNIISLLLLFLFTVIFQLQMQKNTMEALSELKEPVTKTTKTTKTTKSEPKSETKGQSTEDRKVVLLLGSSVTQGAGASSPQKSWAGLLNAHLSEQQSDLIFLNLGVGGYTTKDIVNSSLKITSNLSAQELTPDIIIFENCLINDFRLLTTTESKKNIKTVVSKLQLQFPEAKIYVTPPNDVTVYSSRLSADGLSYQDYVQEVGDYMDTQKWNYVDFWETFESKASKRNVSLEDTLAQDGKHPNDTGYDIWFESLLDQIDFMEL
jgi:lysophospholipase L1-like esterase